VGLVALLLRVLGRIQRREGRGKGRRCASPWVNVRRLERIPQPVTLCRSDPPGAAAAGADPQRVGLVASLPRILERIQRGEGRGKGCRCASPWANVGRLVRIPQPVTLRRCSSTSCASSVVLLLRTLCAQFGHERRGRSCLEDLRREDPQRVGIKKARPAL